MSKLSKPEYLNLSKKVNGGYMPVDYFRKNLFNSSFRDSQFLQRKKTIYDDGNMTIKVNRSLNQKHRDLLSLLMFEKNTIPEKNGSYKILTNIYGLAKKMGYKNPKDATHIIYNLLDDLANTRVYTRSKESKLNIDHNLMGSYLYNDDMNNYEIEVPEHTAKYAIFTTGVLIPQNINNKIVQIANNKSKLKALISFLLSNKKLKNGIGFDIICMKFDILKTDMKSKFKKQVLDNVELLKEFKISYINNKFFLDEQIVEFERAITKEDVIRAEFKEFAVDIINKYNGEDLCIFNLNNKEEIISIQNNKLCVKEDSTYLLISDKQIINSIFKSLYIGKSKLIDLVKNNRTIFR